MIELEVAVNYFTFKLQATLNPEWGSGDSARREDFLKIPKIDKIQCLIPGSNN